MTIAGPVLSCRSPRRQPSSTPDDREVLARWLWDQGHARPDEAALAVADEILTSDWLAEHDAQVRRETAEKIAQAVEGARDLFMVRTRAKRRDTIPRCYDDAARVARQSVEGGA